MCLALFHTPLVLSFACPPGGHTALDVAVWDEVPMGVPSDEAIRSARVQDEVQCGKWYPHMTVTTTGCRSYLQDTASGDALPPTSPASNSS